MANTILNLVDRDRHWQKELDRFRKTPDSPAEVFDPQWFPDADEMNHILDAWLKESGPDERRQWLFQRYDADPARIELILVARSPWTRVVVTGADHGFTLNDLLTAITRFDELRRRLEA